MYDYLYQIVNKKKLVELKTEYQNINKNDVQLLKNIKSCIKII